MYQLLTAGHRESFSLHPKEYRSVDTALRAGKLLLRNRADGDVVVYSDNNREFVGTATKRDWQWVTWKA